MENGQTHTHCLEGPSFLRKGYQATASNSLLKTLGNIFPLLPRNVWYDVILCVQNSSIDVDNCKIHKTKIKACYYYYSSSYYYYSSSYYYYYHHYYHYYSSSYYYYSYYYSYCYYLDRSTDVCASHFAQGNLHLCKSCTGEHTCTN